MAKPADVLTLKKTIAAVVRADGNRYQAAQELGVSDSTVRDRIRQAMRRGLKVPANATPTPSASPVDQRKHIRSLTKDLDRATKAREKAEAQADALRAARTTAPRPAAKPSKIGKEDFVRLIRPDLHGSQQDPDAVAAYLAAAKALNPDELVGLGDLTDCGGFLAEKYTLGYVANTTYSVAEDELAVNRFLDAEAEATPNARKKEIEGNHDYRKEQWCVTTAQRNGGNVRLEAEYLLSRNGPEAVYGFKRRGIDYVRRSESRDGLPPGTLRLGRCLFTHGNFTGRNACWAALRAYGTNVVFGHTHDLIGIVEHVVNAGTIGAWTVGCLAKRTPLWHHAKPSGWVHGFAVQLVAKSGAFQHHNVAINDGQALLFSKLR